jgi:hypothetical protein
MALQKWKATIYEASMPPEAIIKALQERVARQRMLKEKFEHELEAIVRSRRPTSVPSLQYDSCPSDDDVGGFFVDFEP